jgi:MoaA/NifB/PqqE/SkfB family radical SAM enzyme
MASRLFHKLVDDISGVPILSFTGGEPLLHPQVTEFIAYAKSRGHLCTLTTNGWFLAKRAQELCEAGLDLLVVSVDGPGEIHNQVRGNRSFERLLEGLNTTLALPGRPAVLISMTISKMNYKMVPLMYLFARAMGLDGINYNHLWMQTDVMISAYEVQPDPLFEVDHVNWDIDPGKIDVDELVASIKKIRKLNRGHRFLLTETPYLSLENIKTWYQEPERFVQWDTTRCAWVRMKVGVDGNVVPCRDWAVGNIGEVPAMEIWNGEALRQFRTRLGTQGPLPICARCCMIAYR